MMMKTSAIVLAAGLSSRMGIENKLTLPFRGKPLCLHIIDELLELDLEEVIVVVGYEQDKIIHHLNNDKIKIIINENFHSGMTSSIQAGVLHTSEHSDAYLICLSDMPFVKKHHINSILSHHKKKDQIVIPRILNKKSHPILFSSGYKNEILNHPLPNGCKEIIQNNLNQVNFVNFDEDFSIDIDTKEIYLKMK